jgi:hypothetical protein
MCALWVLLVCTAQTFHISQANVLRNRHGTVARARAAKKQAEDAEMQRLYQIPSLKVPDIGVAQSKNIPAPISAQAPESMANVMGYEVTNPTPLPAAFDGVYCKGGACQYRVAPPPPTIPPPIIITPPPLPPGGNALSGREFCRGLACIPGMGMPGSPALAAWNFNCLHLFQDVLGGMIGDDTSRTVAQVYESFTGACKKRVGPLEVGACPGYSNTFLGAEAPKVDNPTVGNVVEVCTDTFWWIGAFKQAEVDLKLTKAALPKGFGSSLLEAAWSRLGSGGVGPSSARGLKWREYAWKHGFQQRWTAQPATAQQLSEDGGIAGAFFQSDAQADPKKDKPLLPGADSDEETPRGLPKYSQNPPCNTKDQHDVPQKKMKYQIAPGSPDGAVPPVEVDGDLFYLL